MSLALGLAISAIFKEINNARIGKKVNLREEMELYDTWLSDLVLVWRQVAEDYDSSPNLFDLSTPIQIYAIHVQERADVSQLSIVFLHDPEIPDLLVKTVGFSDANELAERSNGIETEFGIAGEAPCKVKVLHDNLKIPVYGLMTRALLALHANLKGRRGVLQSPIELDSQLALSEKEPNAAMWIARISDPLPVRDEVVQFIREHLNQEKEIGGAKEKAVESETSAKQAIAPSKLARQCGYAAYPHPHIYWGDPDGPFPSDRIGGIWMPKADLVCRCEGDKFSAWVFSNGRIVTSLCEAPAALKLTNLFFSILVRSGIQAYEVSEDELIEVSNLEKATGKMADQVGLICQEILTRVRSI